MPQAQSHDQQITDFWNAVCQCKHLGTLPQPEAWAFGNGEQQADELAALVIAGQKTATTSAFFPGETAAAVDEYNIILDGRNQPVAVTQTVVSEIMPFTQVSAEHAYHEGEGDQTLTYWRRVHETFWKQEAAKENWSFSEAMLVSCEVFRLVATREELE